MKDKKSEKIVKFFGEKVREIRVEKNITQLDLAAKVGMDVRQIKRIENGESTTSIVNAYLIAKVLDVDLNELFK
jgi:HTH-type transcriptional regulator, competence development regulator